MIRTAHSPVESTKRALGSWPTRLLRTATLALAVVAVVAGPNPAHACAAALETAYADYARVVAGRPLDADEAERAAILDYVDGIAPLPDWILSDLTLETGLDVDRDRIMARISRLNRALGDAAVNQSMGGVLDAIGQW